MSFISDFKAFAIKGNVVDLAIGVIVGGAFGKIVSSLVNDIIMPPLGLMIGGMNFKNMAIVLKPATETTAEVAVRYGLFVNQIIDFVIVAFTIFVAIRLVQNLRRKEEVAPTEATVAAVPSNEEKLLAEIRDLLKKE